MLKPLFQIDPFEDLAAFRDALVCWFQEWGKDYPWRRTRDPYAVLVSEIMLQQTRIGAVLKGGYYERFLAAFPDVESLALAEDEPLLKAWEGLGYYGRARMLREIARTVVAKNGGVFPSELHELLALPGIGPYTAGALRAFAFDMPGVVVDGNVARVISRLSDFQQAVDSPTGVREIGDLAKSLADPARSRSFHSALMELGQTVCRSGVPACMQCPVASFCITRVPENLPIKRAKVAVTELAEQAIVLRDGQGRIALVCEAGKRRCGFWRLPLRTAEEVSELPLVMEFPYTITRYRVTLRIYSAGEPTISLREDEFWKSPGEIMELPLSAPFRKALDLLIKSPASA